MLKEFFRISFVIYLAGKEMELDENNTQDNEKSDEFNQEESKPISKPTLKKTLTMDSLKVPDQPEETQEAPKDHSLDSLSLHSKDLSIERKEKKRRERYRKYQNYVIIFSTLFVSTAMFVMIGYYTIFQYEVEPPVEFSNDPTTKSSYNYSAYGACQHWMIKGDGFCDDEANIELCDYDELDCCSLESDRSLCIECFCYVNISKIASDHVDAECLNVLVVDLVDEHLGSSNGYMIGDGECNIDLNQLEYYFDGGDCCGENVTRIELYGGMFLSRPCSDPECVCIPSYGYAYCVEDQLGDGICQDYNNVQLCNYDHGDCCKSIDEHFEDNDCCICDYCRVCEGLPCNL